MKHDFIFSPGTWIGEGRVSFSTSPEQLRFYTKWTINPITESSVISCLQQVEVQDSNDSVFNKINISHIKGPDFSITLENSLITTVNGKGVIDPKVIAWEYRGNKDFEGFEVYQLQENGDYMLHAEYSSTDEYRTVIDGRIWKKS